MPAGLWRETNKYSLTSPFKWIRLLFSVFYFYGSSSHNMFGAGFYYSMYMCVRTLSCVGLLEYYASILSDKFSVGCGWTCRCWKGRTNNLQSRLLYYCMYVTVAMLIKSICYLYDFGSPSYLLPLFCVQAHWHIFTFTHTLHTHTSHTLTLHTHTSHTEHLAAVPVR